MQTVNVSDQRRDPDDPPIRLTPSAIAFVRARRTKLGRPQAALRVGVRGGGCEGLTYFTDFTDDPPRERDIVLEFEDVRVYLDGCRLAVALAAPSTRSSR